MVELKKRARSRFEQSFESGGFSVPYGDAVSPVVSRSSTRRGLSFEFGGGWSSSKHSSFSWLVKLLYILAVVSCIAAYRTTTEAKTISQSLEAQQTALRLQGDETTLTLKDARMGLQSMRTYVDSLKKTQEALYHEIRMVNEMFEAESASDMPPSPKRGSPDTLVKSWMKHRQDALEHKIENLKAFIQQESRDQVIEKYGDKPRRIKFTVSFSGSDDNRYFVMEMAPLELMPHAVHMFLEMVRMKLWDNTVFWHHDEVEHVIAAALFNFKTGEPKYHHVKALGWDGLQFGEHSLDFPHDKYTVGFSGKGPNMYINLMNNEDVHGLNGSQRHHELPGEADPCFAKIVEGTEVIDKMYELSMQAATKEIEGREPTWEENELTRIVKVELL